MVTAPNLPLGTLPYRPVDADNHYYETRDAFTRYIDPAFADRTFQVHTDPDGVDRMSIDHRPYVFSPAKFDRTNPPGSLLESLRDPANCASFNAMVKARIAEVGVHGGSTSTPPHCDFRTVEYTTGDHMVGKGKWESTRGLGLAFGYNAAEATDDYMTGPQLLDLYREVTAGGGNLLINVGPRADASIPDVQRAPLLALGAALRA